MRKYDIVLANLGNGRTARKHGLRPCVILHNNIGLRAGLSVVIVAPFTTSVRTVPLSISVRKSRINCLVADSSIHPAHIGAIDRAHLGKKLGILESQYHKQLREMIIE